MPFIVRLVLVKKTKSKVPFKTGVSILNKSETFQETKLILRGFFGLSWIVITDDMYIYEGYLKSVARMKNIYIKKMIKLTKFSVLNIWIYDVTEQVFW